MIGISNRTTHIVSFISSTTRHCLTKKWAATAVVVVGRSLGKLILSRSLVQTGRRATELRRRRDRILLRRTPSLATGVSLFIFQDFRVRSH